MININKLIYLLLLELVFIPQAQAEWRDISSSVEIVHTSQALDRINRVLYSYVTIKNISGTAIQDPIRLKIIDPSLAIMNADGMITASQAYFQIDEEIQPGEDKTIKVNFELARVKVVFETQLEQFIDPVIEPELVIPTEIPQVETNQYGVGLTGAEFTDATGNIIRIYLPDIHPYDELTIKQGVDLGDIAYQYDTHKIIEISFPPELSSKQLIVITPSQNFEYVYQFDPESKQMLRMPFVSDEEGNVLLKVEPISGTVYFALVHK